jgi:hypothetical protein
MNRHQLPDEECHRRAAEWAARLFDSGPAVEVAFVRYDAWSGRRAGRRNKPAAVRAEQEVLDALQRGDVEEARAVMATVGHLPDPGLALCPDRESLAAVLAERLRRGEYNFADGLLHERAATLIVWRE